MAIAVFFPLVVTPAWLAGQSRRATVTSATIVLRTPADFPHPKHARLFPTCEGCHADVTRGTTAALFPPAASCATCHEGDSLPRVTWAPPRRPAPQALLAFSHARHFAVADTAARNCASCHATPGASRFMDVGRGTPSTCFSCHAHRTTDHYEPPNRCETCHVPLVRATALSAADVRALPRPRSHLVADFAAAHAPSGPGQQAQCATCHARESCLRCHLNATANPSIAALAPDARVREIVAPLHAAYPVPASHRRTGFAEQHGADAARSSASCANCHARRSCLTCHTGSTGARVIRMLPDASTGAPGVQLRRVPRDGLALRDGAGHTGARVQPPADTARVVRPHPAGFLARHAPDASSGRLRCEGCHTQRFCSDCHAGESRRAFHPSNFVSRHAAPTYARDRECASCHNTEVFCRSCHQAVGLRSSGRNDAGVYHTAQPQWLLQHGRAARLELATCTTCHVQSSCMRCHATTGWGVSPHGAGFNAQRLGRKAMAMCARCHIRDPR